MKTVFEEFLSDPGRRRLFEREALAFQATEVISSLMEKEGVHKSELADRMESSKAHISQLLSGSRNMTIHTLSDLCYSLGYKIEINAVPLAKPNPFRFKRDLDEWGFRQTPYCIQSESPKRAVDVPGNTEGSFSVAA